MDLSDLLFREFETFVRRKANRSSAGEGLIYPHLEMGVRTARTPEEGMLVGWRPKLAWPYHGDIARKVGATGTCLQAGCDFILLFSRLARKSPVNEYDDDIYALLVDMSDFKRGHDNLRNTHFTAYMFTDQLQVERGRCVGWRDSLTCGCLSPSLIFTEFLR